MRLPESGRISEHKEQARERGNVLLRQMLPAMTVTKQFFFHRICFIDFCRVL